MKVSWPKGTKWPDKTVGKKATDIYNIYEPMHCNYCSADCSMDYRRKMVFIDGGDGGPAYMVTICPECEKKIAPEEERR